MEQRIVIVGATSGIGRKVAEGYIARGWKVGVAGRRAEVLEELQRLAPEQVYTQVIDVTLADAPEKLQALIQQLGGMDVFFLSSGVGKQNHSLDPAIELATAATNVEGFVRMTIAAYHFFEKQGYGHLGAISSIAGTKGLGAAPAYSATKRFQNTYLDCLDQLARMNGVNITFTDVRPGFVATPLLKDGRYPMLMDVSKVAKSIIRALDRKKRIAVIDWKYRILVFIWKLIPHCLWVRLPIKN